jgi:hypothetical protein
MQFDFDETRAGDSNAVRQLDRRRVRCLSGMDLVAVWSACLLSLPAMEGKSFRSPSRVECAEDSESVREQATPRYNKPSDLCDRPMASAASFAMIRWL